jgi:polyhydroxybutyrate depolymerase
MHPGIGIKLAVFLGTTILLNGVTGVTAQASSSMPTKMRPGDHTLDLTHSGLKRHYVVHVPPGYDGKTPVPVVIMFHGGGGKARGAMQETGWSGKADKENFLAVYPEGVPRDPTRRGSFVANPQSWNDGSARSILAAAQQNIDDVGFVNAMLDDLGTKFRIDPRRLYATGFSNGASMAFRAGRELSARLAAIAPVAGSDWLDEPRPAPPLSLLYLTGTEDPLNPIEGGDITLGAKSAGKKPPVREFIQKWVKMLGCAPELKTIHDRDGVKGIAYTSCHENAEVVFYTVAGMGHFWPGGMSHLPERIVGKSSNKISATDVIWEFFRKHPKK